MMKKDISILPGSRCQKITEAKGEILEVYLSISIMIQVSEDDVTVSLNTI